MLGFHSQKCWVTFSVSGNLNGTCINYLYCTRKDDFFFGQTFPFSNPGSELIMALSQQISWISVKYLLLTKQNVKALDIRVYLI